MNTDARALRKQLRALEKRLAQGGGLLVVPEKLVSEFRALLVAHYEGTGTDDLVAFMKESCWRRLAIV